MKPIETISLLDNDKVIWHIQKASEFVGKTDFVGSKMYSYYCENVTSAFQC